MDTKTIHKTAFFAFASFILCFLFLAAIAESEPADSLKPVDHSGYVGSDRCASCHQIHYKGWVNTFHSTVIQDA
ncbi:MAG: hypothetical protein GTO08_05725, partial [Deltaproteobacteria bacterium]|nr:hypothetical protein [Deltaproteobacteria bacterium]